MDEHHEHQVLEAAWAFLRANSTASLRFSEHMQDISYVIAPNGNLVISAMVAMLQPGDTVMFVPEYVHDCMELHVSLQQFSESEEGALADRWQVYHGEPPDTQWALVTIDAARFHELFIDGETLCRENPFASHEAEICKELNSNPDIVRNICASKTNVEVAEPFVVGVDPLGVDVRAPFGIVRIQSERTFATPQDILHLFRG